MAIRWVLTVIAIIIFSWIAEKIIKDEDLPGEVLTQPGLHINRDACMADKRSLSTYKAMLEAVPEEISLEDALDLSQQIENFSVIREATTPADYAKFMLSKYCIECEGELFSCANLHKYGEKLMEEKGILLTGYGVLWSLTGQTVEQCLNRPNQSFGMELPEPVESEVTIRFTDIAGHWSEQNIEALIIAGIIQKDDFGTEFQPDEPITRMEMIRMENGIEGATITEYTFTVPPVDGHSGSDFGRVRGYNKMTGQWDQLDYGTTSNGISFTRTLGAGVYTQLEFYYYTNHDCMLDFLSLCVRYGISVCVAGATSSGKTTVAGWVLTTVPDNKRIYTIENGSRELALVREKDGKVVNSVIHTLTRDSDNDRQRIDQTNLLDYALRFNPDVVVVGEMRGAEANAAQEAARTGVAVLTTIHSNSCEATYRRMVSLCKRAVDMSDQTLMDYVTEAYPIVVFCKQLENKQRRMIIKVKTSAGYTPKF